MLLLVEMKERSPMVVVMWLKSLLVANEEFLALLLELICYQREG